MSSPRLRVGVIGAGEVTQVIHLPVLHQLSHLYSVQIVCDISRKNAEHCAQKFFIPQSTTNPDDVTTSPDVDVVFVLTSDEFHESLTVAALRNGKHVMLEKPSTLSIPSALRMLEAEKAANGARIFVGYMRRYAMSFTQTFKREVASIHPILYARSRDFSGPNRQFVSQSGTFPVKNTDFPPNAGAERKEKLDALLGEALGVDAGADRIELCRFLGSLGSHDISLMREALGVPDSVGGISVNHPFVNAIFNYRNSDGRPFAVTYESGIDEVPVFDAHLAVYGAKKRVSIQYDSPYVKGLPIKVRVEELNEEGEITTREILGSYEDAYTSELQEMYTCLTKGNEIKTSMEDAINDLKIFDMMYSAYEPAATTEGANGVQ